MKVAAPLMAQFIIDARILARLMGCLGDKKREQISMALSIKLMFSICESYSAIYNTLVLLKGNHINLDSTTI